MNAVDYLTKKANDNGVFDINQNRQLNTDLSEEQKNKIAKNAFINPNYNKAGISNTFVEGLTDRSKYDYDINWNDNPFKSNDVGDLRAEAQGNWGRLKDAAINNITIAGTTALSSSIGLAGGVVSALVHGDASKIWDNDFNNALNDIQKGVLNNNQIYKGQTYQNKSFLGKATDPIFWAELFQNAGYMEGMLIPGTALGAAAKATQIASKFPNLTKVVTNAIAAGGEASMEAINQRDESYNNLFNQATDIYKNKLTLANNDTEKQEAYNNYLQDLKMIDDDVRAQGNRTFAGNMAILTTTGFLEFGDFVSRGYSESHKLLKAIERNAAGQAMAKGIGYDIARGTGAFVKNFAVEGGEEYTQRGAASGAANTRKANSFLEKYQDEYNIELADNYIQAMASAWADDFNNEEAWLEFLSGALMGGIGIPGSHNGVRAQITDAITEGKARRNLADKINKDEAEYGISSLDLKNNGKLQETFDWLIREFGINEAQDKALVDRDTKKFVDTRVEKILNLAAMYDNAGELDEFKERIKQYSKIDNEDELTNDKTGLIALTTKENGVDSPYKNKSVSEVNQLLQETADFYNKVIDDFVEGKQMIDNYSKGKVDEATLTRGAIQYAQAKNWEQRAGELFKQVKENLPKYKNQLIDFGKEPMAKIINKIEELDNETFMGYFANPYSSVNNNFIELASKILKNGEANVDITEDIVRPLQDLSKISSSLFYARKDYNSILTNYELENKKTSRIVSSIRDKKEKYLINKYAQQLSSITSIDDLRNRIDKIPFNIRTKVFEQARKNYPNISSIIDDYELRTAATEVWNLLYTHYYNGVYTFDLDNLRKKYDTEGNNNVDYIFNSISDMLRNNLTIDDIEKNMNERFKAESAEIDKEGDEVRKKQLLDNFNKKNELFNNVMKDYKNRYKEFIENRNKQKEQEAKKESAKAEKPETPKPETSKGSNQSTTEGKFDIEKFAKENLPESARKMFINDYKKYVVDKNNIDAFVENYEIEEGTKPDKEDIALYEAAKKLKEVLSKQEESEKDKAKKDFDILIEANDKGDKSAIRKQIDKLKKYDKKILDELGYTATINKIESIIQEEVVNAIYDEDNIEKIEDYLSKLNVIELTKIDVNNFKNIDDEQKIYIDKIKKYLIDLKSKQFDDLDEDKNSVKTKEELEKKQAIYPSTKENASMKSDIVSEKQYGNETEDYIPGADLKPVQDILIAQNSYSFVNKGGLAYIYNNTKEKDKKSLIKYVRSKTTPFILLAVNVDNFNRETLINNYNCNIETIDSSNYVIVGALGMQTVEVGVNDESRNSYNTIYNLLQDELGDVENQKENFVISKKYSNSIKTINSGVPVLSQERELVYFDELDKENFSNFFIGFYYEDTLIVPDYVSNSKNYSYVEQNKYNIKPKNGSVYLFVRCADGNFYPRYLNVKRFNDNYDINEEFENEIREQLTTIFTTNGTKSDSERGLAKYILSTLLVFPTHKEDGLKVTDIPIHFGTFNKSINYVNIDGDIIYINKPIEELVDEAVKKLKSMNLRCNIYFGFKDNNYKKAVENLFKYGLATVNYDKLYGVNSNFEVFLVDKNGNIPLDIKYVPYQRGNKLDAGSVTVETAIDYKDYKGKGLEEIIGSNQTIEFDGENFYLGGENVTDSKIADILKFVINIYDYRNRSIEADKDLVFDDNGKKYFYNEQSNIFIETNKNGTIKKIYSGDIAKTKNDLFVGKRKAQAVLSELGKKSEKRKPAKPKKDNTPKDNQTSTPTNNQTTNLSLKDKAIDILINGTEYDKDDKELVEEIKKQKIVLTKEVEVKDWKDVSINAFKYNMLKILRSDATLEKIGLSKDEANEKKRIVKEYTRDNLRELKSKFKFRSNKLSSKDIDSLKYLFCHHL